MTAGSGRAPLRIVALSGSLRAGSLNTALLRAAVELCPPALTIEIHGIGDVPLYNGDLDVGSGPAPVAALKQAVREADGLLIATPEYNYSTPGVLKNALDWLSRPRAESALRDLPVAIMGATGGGFGTVRAQITLRQVLHSTDSLVLRRPELHVSNARERFDEAGSLTDEKVRGELRELLVAFAALVARARPHQI